MEQIIQQIALELAKKITEKAVRGELTDIDALASDVLSDCKSAACSIIETIVDELNMQIRLDKVFRKENGFVLKEKNRPRTFLTELGELNIKRDYYHLTKSGAYSYVLDGMIGISPYARLGDHVKAELISKATDVSYAKSSKLVTDGVVSRQTVHNLILKSPVYDAPQPSKKKEVRAIHIYADEDHVHLQKPLKMKGKSSRIVPLVTVGEGVENVSRNRNRTVNTRHFVDSEFKTSNLWKDVRQYLNSAYENKGDTKVYIYGDGGTWIKTGLRYIKDAEFVVDGYHYERDLRHISKIKPELKMIKRLHIAASIGDRSQAEKAFARMKEDLKGEKLKSVKEFESYVMENWDAIVRRYYDDTVGSCTEAQVSHVLAERFSRNPMGWSKKVLGKLSKARVYKLNGGEITADSLKRHESTNQKDIAKDILKYEIGGSLDWSIFDVANASNGNVETSFYKTANGGRWHLYS